MKDLKDMKSVKMNYDGIEKMWVLKAVNNNKEVVVKDNSFLRCVNIYLGGLNDYCMG